MGSKGKVAAHTSSSSSSSFSFFFFFFFFLNSDSGKVPSELREKERETGTVSADKHFYRVNIKQSKQPTKCDPDTVDQDVILETRDY